MWRIRYALLEQLSSSAKNFYPNEFMCFLAGDKQQQTLTEIVLLPHTSGEDYASIWDGVIPLDESIIASIHSHPDASARPSDADKKFFQRYLVNGIIDGTYSPERIQFYNARGEKIAVQVES